MGTCLCQGIVEYCNSRTTPDDISTDEIVEGLEICQKNNVFEFKGQLYKQTVGHATGQKQAPPVACSGAGIVERKFLFRKQFIGPIILENSHEEEANNNLMITIFGPFYTIIHCPEKVVRLHSFNTMFFYLYVFRSCSTTLF